MYNNILPYLSEEEIKLSGYFEDNFTDFESLDMYPEKIRNTYDKLYNNQKKPIVLLISGCFSPVHQGHLQSLELSKNMINDYVMSIMVPAHDSYVSTKTNEWDINKRLSMFTDLPDDIIVDEIPALHLASEVNFTNIIKRIELILPEVTIGFVFGSDNYGFIFPFHQSKHIPICIEREVSYKSKLESRIQEFGINHIYIEDNPNKHISSTKIRNNIF